MILATRQCSENLTFVLMSLQFVFLLFFVLLQGHPICSYYSVYGLCKYGPTCKFDHPLDAYTYAYTVNIPPLAAPYSPSLLYQRTPPQVPSSEMSPSKSTLSEGIKKGATGSDENWHSNTKGREDSSDQSNSLPNSYKNTL